MILFEGHERLEHVLLSTKLEPKTPSNMSHSVSPSPVFTNKPSACCVEGFNIVEA